MPLIVIFMDPETKRWQSVWKSLEMHELGADDLPCMGVRATVLHP